MWQLFCIDTAICIVACAKQSGLMSIQSLADKKLQSNDTSNLGTLCISVCGIAQLTALKSTKFKEAIKVEVQYLILIRRFCFCFFFNSRKFKNLKN